MERSPQRNKKDLQKWDQNSKLMKENEFSDGLFVLFFVFFGNYFGIVKKGCTFVAIQITNKLNKYK